ncbi:Uncharacterised protein [Helicobacter canis]|uniref:Uncharacterized protein n=2 Tax=Helicobacter canis TaxID=29419 RepID=A0A377J1L9_9HELI|nr:Uncharacterised protein [Helicobacter canis]
MDRHAAHAARDDKTQPSLRGSEATEAIHTQKVDSSFLVWIATTLLAQCLAMTGKRQRKLKMCLIKKPQDFKTNRNNSNHAQRRQDFEARIGALQGERGDKAGSPIAQASRSNPRF